MARFESNTRDLFENAEQSGAPDTLVTLGLMYSTGRDVVADLVEAHKWFSIAALRGNAEARRYRQELASEMSRQEISVAQRRAREWLAQH